VNQPEDFGARLRQAREARGVSLRDIAATTRIAVGALEALERNEVSRLPGGIFTRAFVRSYASEVGLDPEATLKDFLAAFPGDGVADGSPYALESQDEDTFESKQQMAGTWLRLALVSLPVIGLIVYFGMRGATADPEGASAPGGATGLAAATSAPEAGAPAPDPAAEGAVTTGTDDLMLISVEPRSACWVSLTADGDLVVSRVMQPGERERVEARDEILLNIGDAGAFSFTLNGRPGRRLGEAGEVVTTRITPENYREYLAP
jgi:cytoskeletal protein RodZ